MDRPCGFRAQALIAILFATVAASPLETTVDGMFAQWTPSTPGLVIGVAQHGHVILSRAYGSADIRFHIAMQPGFRFNVGSVAKQFTAFAIYDLEAKGRLAVDDPVGKYVPGLSSLVGSIEIRDLLEHTSGLRDYFALTQMSGLTLEDALDSATVVRFANAQRATNFPPGTSYEYSNTNYVLLAEVVKHITGASLGSYLETNVFAPLGMRGTALVTTHGVPLDGLVSSYWPADHGYVERNALLDVQGDGNLITTAADLLLWEENLDTERFGKNIIDRMLDRGKLPGSRAAATRFVNGIVVDDFDGVRRLSADGGIAGYRAAAITFPSAGLSIVMLSNLISLFPDDQLDAISAGLLGKPAPPVPAPSPTPTAASAPTVDARTYEGRYYSADIDTSYWVCPSAGGLELHQLRGASISLKPISPDNFSGQTWWLGSLEFARQGEIVKALYVSGRSVRRVRFARVSVSCAGAE